MKRDDNPFYEKQKIKRWLILLIFIPVNLLLITGCIMQIGLDKPWGNNPIPNEGLIVTTAIMLLLMAYMFRIDLKTVVDNDGIHIRMWLFPFFTKTKSFLWEDISEITVKKYNPILTYGGWGIRMGSFSFGLNFGKMRFDSVAYSMSGNIGMQFILQNKKNVLIGTNKPEELSATLLKIGKLEENK